MAFPDRRRAVHRVRSSRNGSVGRTTNVILLNIRSSEECSPAATGTAAVEPVRSLPHSAHGKGAARESLGTPNLRPCACRAKDAVNRAALSEPGCGSLLLAF